MLFEGGLIVKVSSKSFSHIKIFSRFFIVIKISPKYTYLTDTSSCMNVLILFRDLGEQDVHYFPRFEIITYTSHLSLFLFSHLPHT